MMNMMNTTETNKANGGYYYCKVCGLTNSSQWKIFCHIATKHVGAWTSNLYNLIVKVF